MKSWVIAAIFVSVGALAACDSDGGSDGAGGSGGDTGEGGSTSSSTNTGTNTGTNTNTGTETAAACAEEDAASGTECSQDTMCGQCAVNTGGPCNAEFLACAGNQDCIDYVTCINACAVDDEDCMVACDTAAGGADSEAVMQYNAAQSCVICTACPTSCDAANDPECPAP